MKKTMTAVQAAELLSSQGFEFDEVKVKGEVITLRLGFFYRHGNSSQKIAMAIKTAFPQAEIVGVGDIDKPFRGGASVSQSSHFLVLFRFNFQID